MVFIFHLLQCLLLIVPVVSHTVADSGACGDSLCDEAREQEQPEDVVAMIQHSKVVSRSRHDYRERVHIGKTGGNQRRGHSLAWVSKVYRVLMILWGLICITPTLTFPRSLDTLASKTPEEIEVFCDEAMQLPNGREILQAFVIPGRVEHTHWISATLMGMLYTFTIPYADAYPVFFIVAMMWTLAALTHYQTLFAPSKYIYPIRFNKIMAIVETTFGALGWLSFYVCKAGL